MEIKGSYKMSGSLGVGIKILVSARELDELGNVKYPYSGFSGQEYYVTAPGKKLEKINIPQYDPSNEGHHLDNRTVWWGNAYKFTSLSPYPKDWEFDAVIELWEMHPTGGYYYDWQNNLFSHATGRGELWSEIKEINYNKDLDFYDQTYYNSYTQMGAIGGAQFIGPGLTTRNNFYIERNENGDMISQQENAPFCYYSKDDGFTQVNFLTTQSYTFATATNTESFKFFSIGVPDHAGNVFGQHVDIAPKIYQLSKDVFLPTETYSLNGLRTFDELGTSIISGTFSYVNYNAFDGLRNSNYAFVLKVTAQLGERVGTTFPIKFHNQIESQVLKINLLTGETDVLCGYETTMDQRPNSYFQTGSANIFLPSFFSTAAGEVDNFIVTSVSNIHEDVLPKFMFAVFRDAKNATLVGDIVYYVAEVIGLQNPREILTKNYQLRIQKFNINDLSSCEESIVQVEKSYQSDVPSRPQSILGIQYHPSF